MGKLRGFIFGVMVGLTAAAIGEELKRPAEQREWRGTVAGVPYNFRLHEWSDVAKEYWDQSSDQILTPHAIGLGWGVNFAAVAKRLRELMESRMPATESEQAREPQYR
jgi:hypothetical protein